MTGLHYAVAGAVVLAALVPLAPASQACTLSHPQYTCPPAPELVMRFSGVAIEECGRHYDKTLFRSLVFVSFPPANQSEKYTLILVDPDAPGHDGDKTYLHWIHANLTGSDLAEGRITGKDIVEYRPPTPPANTGTHRYVMLVFREGEGQGEGAPRPQTAPSSRGRFKVHKYALQYGLCGPLALNIFTAAHSLQEGGKEGGGRPEEE